MKEREQNLLIAATEIVGDFKTFGPVLQKSSAEDYDLQSSIGQLIASLAEYKSEEFTCETTEKTHLEKGKVVFAKDKSKSAGGQKIKESEILDRIKLCIDELDTDGLAKLYNSLYDDGNIIAHGDEFICELVEEKVGQDSRTIRYEIIWCETSHEDYHYKYFDGNKSDVQVNAFNYAKMLVTENHTFHGCCSISKQEAERIPDKSGPSIRWEIIKTWECSWETEPREPGMKIGACCYPTT